LDSAALVGISHGALHPRDVLLSSDDARLTGMGIAYALEQAGIAAPVRRPYSAPERIAGGDWGREADVFGLAALIHELLWGRRITGVGRQAAEALTEIPDSSLSALRAVFARALAERPGDRYATALDFADALTSAFTGAAALTPPIQRPSTRGRRSTTHDPRPTTHDQRLTTNDQRLTTNDQRLTTNDQRPTTNNLPERGITAPLQQDFDLSADEDLRAVEDARSADPEVAPAVMPFWSARDGVVAEEGEPPLDRMFDSADTAPSRTWPMAIMLIVGVALGFAVGYGYRNIAPPAATPASAPPPTTRASATTPPPSGREFTESAVPDDRARPSTSPGPAVQPKPNPSAPAAAAPPEKAANVGRLLVRSSPSGAAVLIDGRDVGLTPVAVRDLDPGPHRLRVAHDGYVVEERRVVITAAQPSQSIIMNLEPRRGSEVRASQSTAPETIDRFTGALVVESRPSGAKVFIDNKLVGTTPLSLATIATGDHAVRLEREGYRPWMSRARVAAGERGRVTASLER
jgi:hypothetical protein